MSRWIKVAGSRNKMMLSVDLSAAGAMGIFAHSIYTRTYLSWTKEL
jgi:hypothetical protein